MSLTRTWIPPGPYDLGSNLRVLQRGPYDPTYRRESSAVWRGTRTPDGPAALRLCAVSGAVRGEAWGPGAAWVLDGLPALLGAEDEPAEFVPHHALTREAQRRNPGLRLIRTGRVLESLIPSVLEQKITTEEAYRAWRRLVRGFGERAPGPHPDLWVMPAPRDWLRVPSWEWHRAGVDQKRSAAILRAVQRASRMEEAAHMTLDAALARLQAIPGIGPWTAAEALQRSNGAPDAVTVGDLHLPRIVTYALTGERNGDDARMLELLAPYEGQRHRASRLINTTGRVPPRREPKREIGNIAPL
ncbi:DNA-3-methyladenine glycosylase family protein [Streptomyces sp. NPDC048172]|uniref:DNA-3-methyladenine glycosylase family protein n=1 Tax=Streptomyces sp. NPDC048172 TaxID=3365505 RepID=UPI0037233D7E